MLILSELRARNPNVPVLVFSATNDRDLIDSVRSSPCTTFLSKWNIPSIKEVVDRAEKLLGSSAGPIKPNSFIAHGHDEKTVLELKNFLQNCLGFPEPVILRERPSLGKTLIEKLEGLAAYSHLAFVLLTPDDPPAGADDSNDGKRRARQNVIFELGYFLGLFGRESGRVFLLYKGPLELPTDLAGVVYIDISSGIDAAGENIRKELAHVLS